MGMMTSRTELKSVQCAECKFFTPPEPQYERSSMGMCQIMNQWLDKFPDRRPDPKTYDRNYAKLGNYPPYPFHDRFCIKFQQSSRPWEQDK